MNIISEKAVWINLESDRYFIIPNDVDLPEGLFELKTVSRDEKSVLEISVAEYEVTEAEAHQWMEDQVSEQMNRAKDAVKNDFANRRKESQQLEEPVSNRVVTGLSMPISTPTLTMVTDEKKVSGAILGGGSMPIQEAESFDEYIREAVSILNKTITQIELNAAQAVSELQALKEKMSSKTPM